MRYSIRMLQGQDVVILPADPGLQVLDTQGLELVVNVGVDGEQPATAENEDCEDGDDEELEYDEVRMKKLKKKMTSPFRRNIGAKYCL